MTNPLLQSHELPPFSAICPEHVVPAIETILNENRAAIAALLAPEKTYTYANLVLPLDDLDDRLNRAWSPVSHMNSVANSDELREAYNACLPLLSAYATEVGQNETLYQAYRSIADGAEFATLNDAQRAVIEHALRDFRLSGVDLPEASKNRYKEIAQELSALSSRFQDQLLDATQAFAKTIADPEELQGLPESALAMAKQAAAANQEDGWRFTLEYPSYIAIMTYADRRELRQQFYGAYATRASDQGPNAGEFDNSDLMERILALRHEEAQLLGFANFAELSLATKMAPSCDAVIGFLEDLAARSLPHGRKDLQELAEFGRQQCGIDALEAWDVAYLSEKLREHKYSLSEEEIRPYFPVPKVLEGLFKLVGQLYGLRIRQQSGVDVWHLDAAYFLIEDSAGEPRGAFYLDLYARAKKRGGAWMDECVTRRRVGAGGLQLPVAFLTCNFTPPAADHPALLRHDEVVTLFHEFGHGLHHLLTRIECAGVSGIHGVEWDAVELPSQFMENFCWEPEALALLSGHYQTGEPLPGGLLEKMLAARNFQSGMQMLRQLEFALFDFRIHREFQPEVGGRIYEILGQVRDQVAVLVPPSFNRFAHSFSHIFAGGYGAGYYSYKWAEVLSSDAYSLFEERGLFNSEVGNAFLTQILERGGSRKAMASFVAFRGREPQIDALLRHNGIVAESV